MAKSHEELITPAAAARVLGLNKSTLNRQIAAGKIRTHHGGKVYLSEVQEDREGVLNSSKRRKRRQPEPPPVTTESDAEEAIGLICQLLREEGVPVDPRRLTLDQVRMAESAIRTRERAFALECEKGEWVRAAEVHDEQFTIWRYVRTAGENSPRRASSEMAVRLGVNTIKLEIELEGFMRGFFHEIADWVEKRMKDNMRKK